MPPAYTTKPLTGMPAPPPLPKEQLELRREVSEDPENQWQNPLRGLRPPPNDILRAATSLRAPNRHFMVDEDLRVPTPSSHEVGAHSLVDGSQFNC